MEAMTAAEAREAAKGLTFEDVWAALMESRTQIVKTFEGIDRLSARVDKTFEGLDRLSARVDKTSEGIDRLSARVDKTSEAVDKMSKKVDKTSDDVAKLSKNMDGVNKSLGKWIEEMVYPNLWDKFDQFGYEFTKGGRRLKFKVNGQTIAEVDIFLENGDYAMPVEVKTTLTQEDVDDHLERLDKIRLYMDNRGDRRLLIGAVAGAIVPESVCSYAQKKGLYVLVQSGDSVVVAEMAKGFTAQEW